MSYKGLDGCLEKLHSKRKEVPYRVLPVASASHISAQVLNTFAPCTHIHTLVPNYKQGYQMVQNLLSSLLSQSSKKYIGSENLDFSLAYPARNENYKKWKYY